MQASLDGVVENIAPLQNIEDEEDDATALEEVAQRVEVPSERTPKQLAMMAKLGWTEEDIVRMVKKELARVEELKHIYQET